MFDPAFFDSGVFQAIASPPVGNAPGIGGDDPATCPSLSGILESGCTRSDYLPNTNWITLELSGVDVTGRIDPKSINVNDIHGEEQDTANFTYIGSKPQVGSRVVIYNNTHAYRLFGGAVSVATQAPMYGTPQPEIWRVNCMDWNYFLNRKKVWKRYVQQPADQIIKDAVANFSVGITTVNVKSPAPEIYEIEFGGIYLHELITRVANRVGWHWYIDEHADIHFYDVEEVYARPIEPERFHWWDLTYAESVEQLRNRIWGEGGGGKTTQFIAPGSLYVNLDTVGWYPTTPPFPQVTVGGQIFRYASVDTINKRLVVDYEDSPGVTFGIGVDTPVNILVMVEDVPSQERMAAIEGPGSDGIHEFRVSDGRFGMEGIMALAISELTAYKDIVGRGSFKTFDDSMRAGRFLEVRLPGRGINIRGIIGKVATQVRAPRRYFEKQVEFTTAHHLDFYDVIRRG